MAIRLRVVNGRTVALCAAETDAKSGDVYLDDAAHEALTEKYLCDWSGSGLLRVAVRAARSPEAEGERVRDAEAALLEGT